MKDDYDHAHKDGPQVRSQEQEQNTSACFQIQTIGRPVRKQSECINSRTTYEQEKISFIMIINT